MKEAKSKVVSGIDVGKEYLEVCCGDRTKRYKNTDLGIEAILRDLKQEGVELVVLEYTGKYEQKLCNKLWESKVGLSIVNPRLSRHFAKSMNVQAKTDKVDAKILKLFGEKMPLKLTQAPSLKEVILKDLFSRRNDLTEMLVAEKNRRKVPGQSGTVETCISLTIAHLEDQIAEIDAEMQKLVMSDAQMSMRLKALLPIKGIAERSACALIAALPELGILNRKEIAALVGVAPRNRESGSFFGAMTTGGGRKQIRSLLYMCTLTAIRHNQILKNFYSRLVQKGKKKMLALVATMRKFIIYINSVIKDEIKKSKNPAVTLEA